MDAIKKLSGREQKLVLILFMGLLAYVLFQYVFSPMQVKKAELKGQMEILETEMKDLDMLQNELDKVKSESSVLEEDIKEMDAKKGFGVMDYQELLTYLGDSAQKYGVDVVNFERLSYVDRMNYWEVPFEVSVQGEYQDLILFVDSIYQLKDYFAIRQLNLHQIELVPTTLNPEGETEAEAAVPQFPWVSDFVQRLNQNSALDMELEVDEENVGAAVYADYLEQLQKGKEKQEKVELMFVFHFISLEEAPANMKVDE